MKGYKVNISTQAKADIDSIIEFIYNEFKAPLTAKRYYDGLFAKMYSLSIFPYAYPISQKTLSLEFGVNTRRINYKKFAIIYSISENDVYIHRVIAQSLL